MEGRSLLNVWPKHESILVLLVWLERPESHPCGECKLFHDVLWLYGVGRSDSHFRLSVRSYWWRQLAIWSWLLDDFWCSQDFLLLLTLLQFALFILHLFFNLCRFENSLKFFKLFLWIMSDKSFHFWVFWLLFSFLTLVRFVTGRVFGGRCRICPNYSPCLHRKGITLCLRLLHGVSSSYHSL